MARSVSWILLVFLLIALSSFGATGLPNLGKTLRLQQELVQERPFDAQVHNDLGNLLVLADRIEEAESAYKKAIELSPGEVSAHFNLGILLQQEGRGRAALAHFERVMEIDPRHAWAHYQSGVVLASRGDRSRAVDFYARAFALDPRISFASNNPHVIDNPEVMEALLRSEKYQEDARSKVPRHYSERARIVQMMLSDDETEAENTFQANEAMEKENAYDEEEELPSRTPSLKTMDSNGTVGTVEEEPARRTLTSDDLDNRRSGQARSSRSGRGVGSAIRNGGVATGKESGRSVGRGSTATGTNEGTRPGSSIRDIRRRNQERGSASRSRAGYRPGIRSTGRLEFEILPAEEAERMAGVGQAI